VCSGFLWGCYWFGGARIGLELGLWVEFSVVSGGLRVLVWALVAWRAGLGVSFAFSAGLGVPSWRLL